MKNGKARDQELEEKGGKVWSECVRCNKFEESSQGFYFSLSHPVTFGQVVSINDPISFFLHKEWAWSRQLLCPFRWSMTMPGALTFATLEKLYQVPQNQNLPLPLRRTDEMNLGNDMPPARHLVSLWTGTSHDAWHAGQYETARTRLGTRRSSLSRWAQQSHSVSSLHAGEQIPELTPKMTMKNLHLVWGSRRLAGDQNER